MTEMLTTCTMGATTLSVHCTVQCFKCIVQLSRFKGKHLEGMLSMTHVALDDDPLLLVALSKADFWLWFIWLSGLESLKTKGMWHELHVAWIIGVLCCSCSIPWNKSKHRPTKTEKHVKVLFPLTAHEVVGSHVKNKKENKQKNPHTFFSEK